jgi:hypothetical protein
VTDTATLNKLNKTKEEMKDTPGLGEDATLQDESKLDNA